MKNSILLVSTAREKSSRCSKKMIKKFHNTTLFDIHAEKLEILNKCNHNLFNDIILAIGKSDNAIWDKAKSYNIKIQERDKFSITNADKESDIHNYLRNYKQKYVFWLNSSSPFLETDTILNILKYFKINRHESLLPIIKEYNWFWKQKSGYPINISNNQLTHTQDSQPIYKAIHSFHIFNREYMLENDAFWDFTQDNPYFYEVKDSIEFLDVDTKMDFKICESIYRSRYEKTDNSC